MFNSMGGYSLADIAAATRNGNGTGFGDSNDWWVIILFLLALGGWGANGNGGGLFGGGNGGFREAVSYGFDMNNLENGIRGIQQGLCDGFYAQNSTMLQGFSGLNTQIANTGFGLQTALNQGFNGIQAQMAQDALVAQQCCCDTQNLISSKFCDLNYNIATQACDTRRAIADSSRDIIDNQNAGTRAILDFLTQDKITELTAENQSLKLRASQEAQNNFLIRELGQKLPIPAYTVPNPYAGCYSPCNYNYGCGC